MKFFRESEIALVVDLEATCWRGRPPEGMYNEIIEIGISGIDHKTKEIVFKDGIIVKPRFSEISNFCTELTSIDQKLVDEKGVDFITACQILKNKFSSKNRLWMSFGDFDKKQMQRDCKLNCVENPMGKNHIDLMPLFNFSFNLKKGLGVSSILEHLDMEFEGVKHRAIDDAYNTALILQRAYSGSSHIGFKPKKKEHEILEEFLKSKYNEDELIGNMSRVLRKNMPPK